MAVTVEKMKDEPIIRATVTGNMTGQDAVEIFTRSAEILKTIKGHAFRITDVRKMDTNFADVMDMLKEASKGMPGSTTDPNLSVVMVGPHSLTRFFANAMRQGQFGSANVPVFQEMDDALDYVRMRIKVMSEGE